MTKYVKTQALASAAAAVAGLMAMTIAAYAQEVHHDTFKARDITGWSGVNATTLVVNTKARKSYRVDLVEGCDLTSRGGIVKFRAGAGNSIDGLRRDRIQVGGESCAIISVQKLSEDERTALLNQTGPRAGRGQSRP